MDDQNKQTPGSDGPETAPQKPEPTENGDTDPISEPTTEQPLLSPVQERAISALMTEQSIQRAADIVGVHPRTIHKWLAVPEFASEYRRVRRESFRQAVSLCQRLSTSAVATLAKVMGDPTTPPSAKVSAAQALLKFGRDGIEIEDIEVRVEELERTVAVQDGHGAAKPFDPMPRRVR